MLSRVSTLNGITILRSFSRRQIDSHIPQTVHNELKSLDKLAEVSSAGAHTELTWYYDRVEWLVGT